MGPATQTIKREQPVVKQDIARKPRWPPIPGFKPRSEDAVAHWLRGIPAAVLLVGAGLVSTCIYALFVAAFPLTRWYNHPHVTDKSDVITDMGQITHYNPLAAIGFIVAVVVLFACQFLAYTALSRPRTERTRRLELLSYAFPLVFVGILIWMQPVTSTDLYGYVARGYLYARLHLNPMTTPAFLLPGNLLVSRPPAPYGPVWLLIAGGFSLISGANLFLNLFLFKALDALGTIVCVVMIGWLARSLYRQSTARIVLFFAWSPLVLWEEVGNGHNDVAMMACVLGALLLMIHRHSRWAFALLVLGTLIKYTAAFLIPLWLVFELGQLVSSSVPVVVAHRGARHARRARSATGGTNGQRVPSGASADGATFGLADARSALAGTARSALSLMRDLDFRAATRLIASVTAIGLVMVSAAYAPFWDGWQTFSGLGQQVRPLYYNGSIVQFIAAPLELLVPQGSYTALDKTIRLLFYALFALYVWNQTHRLWLASSTATMRDLITAGAKIMFAALILIAFWFQPWYVVWLLPLAALADEAFVRNQAAILSMGCLLTYAVGLFSFASGTDLGQSLFGQFFVVLIAFLPLLLLRLTPMDRNWLTIVRGYFGLVSEGLRRRQVIWDRVMLGLILVVAVLLRLVRLGNLFGAINIDAPGATVLRQVSDDMRLVLADPRGLEGPFVLLQRLSAAIFGNTPFALLLPSAVIGSLTVLLVYLVTTVILGSDSSPQQARAIGLLAALLAATSEWHVSLSRAGVQIVALPFLMCLALYLLLLALRARVNPVAAPVVATHRHGHQRRRPRHALKTSIERLRQRRVLLFVGSGVAAGLASDIAPGLWILPVLVFIIVVIARWQRPHWYREIGVGLLALAASIVIAGLPGVWQYYLKPSLGARTASTHPALHAASFWQSLLPTMSHIAQQVGNNTRDVFQVLTAQDYSASWPASGGTPIVPAALGIVFYVGLAFVVWNWRKLSSTTIILLVAFPFLAAFAIGSESNVIQAASILPAICIVPAVMLYWAARGLGSIPIVFDRTIGARFFANPERIGRVLLMVFLLFSALRTFYWYFQATLPITPPNTLTPN